MIQAALLKDLGGYIDGQWLAADDGRLDDVINPATHEIVAQVPHMGRAEAERAVHAASMARHAVPDIDVRRRWLEAARDALLAKRDEIGRILCIEHGKPLAEACDEVDYAASFFDYYAATMEQTLAPEAIQGQVKHCSWTIYKRPIGVVGLITPWNFPLGMIAKKLAPALAAGCPVIVKPALETPLTMIALFRAMLESTELPVGMINLVIGDARAIGGVLMQSTDVHMVSFTGSTGVGQMLIEQSAHDVKKLDLELGGNAPFIVLDDADLDKAVAALMRNKFRGAGQTCVCANRIYVQAAVHDAFCDKLRVQVQALKLGNGMDPGVTIGPLINAAGFNKVKQHLADALANGATQLTGKHPDELDADRSLLFPPTVLTDVTHEMRCCREESFGPLVPVIRFDTDDAAVKQANATEYGLAAYVFSSDKKRAHQIIAQLHFGHCGYNTGTGPAAHAPFGGMLSSGIGREGGRDGLLGYVELQTVPDGS